MASAAQGSLLEKSLTDLAAGLHRDPFAVLGPHPDEHGREIVVRTLQPAARAVDVRLLSTGELHPMRPRGKGGIFEATIAGAERIDYRLRITYASGLDAEVGDPYRYGRVLSDFDLHLIGEGTHRRLFEKLGAHRIVLDATSGVHFAVWAPNADRVSVIGDSNGWDGRIHPMRLLVRSGVWELFIPELPEGEKYKFEIRTRAGGLLKKSDPFGFAFEIPPQTASVVHDLSG